MSTTFAATAVAPATPTRLASPVSSPVSSRVSRVPLEHPHTYRRRRIVVGVVLAAVLTVVGAAVSGTLAGPGGVPASATGAQPSFERPTVVVRAGDTLWSIAHLHRGEVGHARYLDELVMLNGGASIQVGQRLVLP